MALDNVKPAVLNCVGRVLAEYLGEDGKAAIQYHLRKLGADPDESFDKPVEFTRVMNAIFGPGSHIMEMSMVVCIAKSVRAKTANKSSFTDFVMGLNGGS